eukprot:764916-Hanusia_phi.AAC.2
MKREEGGGGGGVFVDENVQPVASCRFFEASELAGKCRPDGKRWVILASSRPALPALLQPPHLPPPLLPLLRACFFHYSSAVSLVFLIILISTLAHLSSGI